MWPKNCAVWQVRLLFHGRLLLAARSHQLLLHASLDPYNTTEEMDVSWTDMELVWSEASIRVHGTLDIYVRTASKYDDGHLLHLPNLSFQIKMDWVCLANPKVCLIHEINDMLCASIGSGSIFDRLFFP